MASGRALWASDTSGSQINLAAAIAHEYIKWQKPWRDNKSKFKFKQIKKNKSSSEHKSNS